MLVVKNMSKSYNKNVLSHFSYTFNEGYIYSIIEIRILITMPSKAGCAKEQTHPTVWYIINAGIATALCHLIDRMVDNHTHNKESYCQHRCNYQWNKNLLTYGLLPFHRCNNAKYYNYVIYFTLSM